jgi:GNAT superfamily N-acetyltransferase
VSAVKTATYSMLETLRDGRRVEIRALQPDDQAAFGDAVSRASGQSLYRRFFVVRIGVSEAEIASFMNVDFVNRVALIAVMKESSPPVILGGARYVVSGPSHAEMAFAVIDAYQRQGIGTILMRHLGAIARQAGINELVATVLPENTPMLRVFERSGFSPTTKRGPGWAQVTLRLL